MDQQTLARRGPVDQGGGSPAVTGHGLVAIKCLGQHSWIESAGIRRGKPLLPLAMFGAIDGASRRPRSRHHLRQGKFKKLPGSGDLIHIDQYLHGERLDIG